jgi:hypothetical protein
MVPCTVFSSLLVPAAARRAKYTVISIVIGSGLRSNVANTNVTVLELAATIDWLARAEEYADWRSDLIKRKGTKARQGRLERAVELLQNIGLPPPVSLAA